MHSDLQQLEQQLPPRERLWLRAARYAGWTLVGVYFVAALAVLALRFLVLPNVDAYTDRIAAAASRALGGKVTIGNVAAEWSNVHPRLQLSDVRIYDRDDREALRLPHVDVTVAWRSIVYGRPILRSLVLDGPNLHIRRDAAGRVQVAGLEVRTTPDEGPGLADAVLDMKRLLIRDAAVQWDDEHRRAPPLKLERVSILVENSGRTHRFALSADPPADYAAPLDVRGELVGRSLKTLDAWDGRLFVASDYVDLAAWSAWVDYPVEIAGGRGALRLWATLRDWVPQDLTADVSLADVSARVSEELPWLELKWVEGRVGAREIVQGFEFIDLRGPRRVTYEAFGRRLGLEIASGATFTRADFQAHWDPGSGKQPPQGRASASSLDLAPLAALGEALPFPLKVRDLLARTAPRGRLEDVTYTWTGDVENPATYTARGRFLGLGMIAHDVMPGFGNVSGSAEFTERGGNVVLQSAQMRLEQRKLWPDGPLEFDSLSGQAGWTVAPGRFEMRVDNVTLANAEISASVSGTFRKTGDGGGEVDFTGRVPRADAGRITRYLPNLEDQAATWLKRGLVAAQMTDGRIRVKGATRDFPFDDPKKGVFEATAKFANGTLDYAEGWPRIAGLAGDFAYAAGKIRVQAARGSMYGIQFPKVTATITELFNPTVPSILSIEGRAEGPTADFLRFIAESPVDRFTDQTFRGWTAEGRGRLNLSLDVPLSDMARARVNGGFQLLGNAVNPGIGELAVAQVDGRIDFTESGVNAKGIVGQWLGGPFNLDVSTRAGATQIAGQGTVSVPAVMKVLGLPLSQRVSGSTPFRFAASIKGPQQGVTVDASLLGVAIDLPPPFDKPAAEAWPLRVERTVGSPGAQSIDVTLAKILNARAQILVDGAKWSVERAGIGIGDVGVPLPDRPGVFVSANLKTLDLDRFVALQLASESGGATVDVGAISIRAGELIVGGKRFHDVSARVLKLQPTRWQATVGARELAGDISYGSDGKGAVIAKLKRLVQPEAAEPAAGASPHDALESLPAIELSADSYVFRERELGRLELRAVNERRGWRVERASLASPECTLDASGLWQPRTATAVQTTEFEYSIAVSNIGGCLDRLGYPETVKGGTALLQGRASWDGPVYAIDYPTLNGKVTLTADKGQFLRIQPGIGKLLGVLSLQSLPRRITLDFRDVFSDGFAFDGIRGTATIERGTMRTSDLTMIGPAATVAMKGAVDLARETQDLNVRVVPVVGDSVAAAAGVALLNPIIGAGALLAQRILKDPLGQMFAFEYRVTGGWDDPRVERLNAAVANRPAGETQ